MTNLTDAKTGWVESFSRQHPLKIKDSDIFLHGTSKKRYENIQTVGFMLRNVPKRNFSISEAGICFEKYDKNGRYAGGSSADFTNMTIKGYCEAACRTDKSSEGIILRITGKGLNKLGCRIYADWNKNPPLIRDSDWVPIDIDSNAPVLSIIVLDIDVPIELLEVERQVPYTDDFP